MGMRWWVVSSKRAAFGMGSAAATEAVGLTSGRCVYGESINNAQCRSSYCYLGKNQG